MSVIDYERAWVELKAHIVSKNSHGQRELLTRMAEVEIDCRVPEGERGYEDGPTPLRARAPRSRGSRVGAA